MDLFATPSSIVFDTPESKTAAAPAIPIDAVLSQDGATSCIVA